MVYILGISCFYHDAAAALLRSGLILSAVQEERFSRVKHDSRFPHSAIAYCLESAGITAKELDRVIFYEQPAKKFRRILYMLGTAAPRALLARNLRPYADVARSWLGPGGKLRFKAHLRRQAGSTLAGFDWRRFSCVEHHRSHAASAFFPSPFEQALILTVDGIGEWASTAAFLGEGSVVTPLMEVHYPHSLGLLYSAFTRYLGFRVNSGEYKVMGLAPYGRPRYRDLIMDRLLELRRDGTYRLDMRYFDFWSGGVPYTQRFCDLFEGPGAPLDTIPRQREMDIAASIQAAIEESLCHIAGYLQQKHGVEDLCMAGGVALNCVANARLMRRCGFRRLWVQPAAGDAGGALGAALEAHYHLDGAPRVVCRRDQMAGSYLGPSYSHQQVTQALAKSNATAEHWPDLGERNERIVELLALGKAVGRFDGRMEYGPRALGNRSILADPRDPEMQRRLNLKIKFRESFRPFAPSVLEEYAAHWFNGYCDSSYMTLVADLVEEQRCAVEQNPITSFAERINAIRSSVPAITHLDYSARLQTVSRETNPDYHDLISRFYRRTGVPMLVNTSFNVRGEPIVCTPADAIRCFMTTDMDYLALGSYILDKAAQPAAVISAYSVATSED